MFRDNYTNFTFDDLKSENFKVWITNKNDLKWNMSPNFSDKFNTPTYGQIRYHEGTTVDKQDFKLSCVAVNVTLDEWRAITEWLSPLKSGKLTFDWNDKYYYMVKLSKAPSGTIFIKNKIDNVMGQLFIVTFDLEFTTVYDWAASGQYCEQSMSTATGGVNDYTLVDPSIFNNSYYIPQIIRSKSTDGTTSVSFDSNTPYSSRGADEIKFECTSTTTSSLIIQLPDTTPIYKLEYKKINVSDTDFSYCWYIATSNSLTPTWALLDTDFQPFTIRMPSKHCILSIVGSNWKGYFIKKENLAFCNPGAFESYPMFYVPGNFKVEKNNELIYSYETNAIAPSNEVVINNKQFTFTCGGKNIESITNYSGQPIFTNIDIRTQLVINSGRPEKFKAVFIEDRKLTASEGNTGDSDYRRKATFLLNNKPIYDRFKPFVLHAYDQEFLEITNQYSEQPYSSNYYTINDNYNSLLLIDPVLKIVYEKDRGYKLEIYYFSKADDVDGEISAVYSREQTNTKLQNNYFKNRFNKNGYIYISLCDCEWLQITGNDNYSMGFATREVV